VNSHTSEQHVYASDIAHLYNILLASI